MTNKYGSYIQKLMTVVLDEEQEEFVRNLSWDELQQIRNGIDSFLEKRKLKGVHEKQENKKQRLLFD